MKKRRWQDANDRADLGLSRSTLRDLDVAEGIQNDLDRIQRDIDSVQEAQRSLGFDASKVDTIGKAQSDIESRNVDEADPGLADTRVNLADFRPGPVDNMVPTASDMLKRQAESVRASIYRPPSLLRENVVKGLAKPPIPPSTMSQILDTRSRMQGMFRTLSEITVKPSLVLPATTSITRISDVARGVAASEMSKNRQDIYSLLETVNRSFSKSLAGPIMASNPLSDASLVMRKSIAASVHSMNADMIAAWRSMMMPNIEAIRRQLSTGIIGTLSQYDWETLERQARIQDARRPRTPIGFAARDAYDAFYLNQPWIADRFLRDRLDIEPNEDRREALWRVLRWTFERTIPRPVKWLVMEDEKQVVKYLRAAIYKNERRVRTEKQRPDRVWWEERDPETKKKIELPPPTLQPDDILELMMRSAMNPADIVISQLDCRLDRVLEMLYLEGTEQDKRMVGMIRAGFDLPDIAEVVGWSEVQRFTRKAQRWGIKRIPYSDG